MKFFCLCLTNHWYGSTSKHLELWLEVSKTLHKSINPVSWLFTILEPFSPERSKNPPKTKDLLFIQKCWQTLRDVFWHQIEAFTIDLCKKKWKFHKFDFFCQRQIFIFDLMTSIFTSKGYHLKISLLQCKWLNKTQKITNLIDLVLQQLWK